jgi:Ubiquitin family
MQLFLFLGGYNSKRLFINDVEITHTYKELKQKIAKMTLLSKEQFQIIYNGRYIEHFFSLDDTLEKLSIGNLSILHFKMCIFPPIKINKM